MAPRKIVDDFADSAELLALPPRHETAKRLPATMIVSGDAEQNCNALHARKMTARLQAATSSPAGDLDYRSAGALAGASLSSARRAPSPTAMAFSADSCSWQRERRVASSRLLRFGSVPPVNATVERYWDFDPAKRIRYASDREYEQHFRTVFAEAVRRRLRSERPVLAELSGGMDSSSIVCMADSLTQWTD